MGKAIRPDRERITDLALETLEEVLARAEHGPVEHQQGHRLALAWLASRGALLDWHAAAFWREMADPHAGACTDGYAHYYRSSRLTGLLDNWYQQVGRKPPDRVERARRAKRYNPDLDEACQGAQRLVMCNRYKPGERTRIEDLFNAKALRAFNDGPETVHPKDPAPVVRIHGGQLVLDQMSWGFPVRLRGKRGELLQPKAVNNARFDKIGGYWKRWAHAPANRCLIPTERFAEAIGTRGAMCEAWLSVKDQPIFAWAGLWSHSAEWGDVFTGVMTSAASELVDIHDRSPVILEKRDWMQWLTLPMEELKRFDKLYPAARIEVEKTDRLWKTGEPANLLL